MFMRFSHVALGFACAAALACVPPADDSTLVTGEVIPEEEVGTGGKFLRVDRPVPGQYIVVLKDDFSKGLTATATLAARENLAAQFNGKIFHQYQAALNGFAVRMSAAQAEALSRHPAVDFVQEDRVITLAATQTGATWGIDRIDQRDLPLSTTYVYNATGAGVHAYIIDTGVRLTHSEFTGRMGNGFDAVTTGGTANDCNGHGTHVAGTVGGTTYGVAKSVTLHPVRVLDCNGSGTTAGVVAGVDWVTANKQTPAVANMSLGGGADTALDNAVRNSIAAGVTYSLASGNSNADACNSSPARTLEAITVNASTNTDARASFSNWGTCTDIFAPGNNITSAWHSSDTSTNTISGTSMAAPHVAGAAALYLQGNPGATPDQVAAALFNNSTPNKITSPGTGSPNRLLYTGFIGGGGETTPPTASLTAPSPGATVAGTVTVSATASDNVGVTRVDFFAGSTQIGSDTSSPYSVSWDTTTGANGSVTLTARAWDAAGNMGDSSPVSVTVNNPGQASYDSALRAPKCGTVGNRCDSGALLVGRNNLGPEPNQPNTINGSCADGASGTFHSDESLDSLKVTAGSDFAPGVTVTVTATVWAWSTPSSDALDLYYAANANSPTWTLIGTFVPTAGGANTITATYTLPSGSLQAIRGRFRYQGSAGSCGTGSYDDHDDLVFAVGGGTPDTTPPTTSITAPANGATVSGTVTISASASDNVGVARVEFYHGTTLIGSDTTSPYSVSWDTTAVANGSYSLTSRAFDAAGNSASSSAVNVTVNNTTGQERLTNGGFETSISPWVSSGSGAFYTANGAYPHGGTGYLYLGVNNSVSGQSYQQISIPSGTAPKLSFWLNVVSSETTTTTQYDRLFVEVRNTSGTLLATLATYSNLDKAAAGVYSQKGEFSLAAYAGQTIRIQFRATTDFSLATTFRIDDASVK
jgi:subtilisin family serine protease